ncbi:hypothetical protein P7K49_019043 [Saguinus oedipus]|uniref:Uncharacterized protein n=1 Tax=Saguinus oedipus TaxID=9490 RepID=A0ABQ9UYS3_SAGOE|nr:hypothetical protein P7K49_019043 [Saguinus oedipus]
MGILREFVEEEVDGKAGWGAFEQWNDVISDRKQSLGVQRIEKGEQFSSKSWSAVHIDSVCTHQSWSAVHIDSVCTHQSWSAVHIDSVCTHQSWSAVHIDSACSRSAVYIDSVCTHLSVLECGAH